MTAKVKNRTRNGLSGIAAILALTGFMTIVATATASETIQRTQPKVPNKVKLAAGVVSLVTAASVLTLRDVKFNGK